MKCFKYFIVSLITVFSFNAYSYEINKVTYASWDKPDVDLYYVLPNNLILGLNYATYFFIQWRL